jgi:ferrochelatase
MPTKSAVLLVNLGTPASPHKKDVARFLKQFLSDTRVIEAPRWLWQPLLRCVIVPLRAKKSAHAYQQIWSEQGSPLKVISQQQVSALQSTLQQQLGNDAPQVVEACTYGEPSIKTQTNMLVTAGVERIVVIPMYPQYSATTTAAVWDQLADAVKSLRNVPDLTLVRSFYQRQDYIEALAQSVREHWQTHGKKQKLLMSFHGIPQEYADKGDPYPAHCQSTAARLAQALALSDDQWLCSYQSRFGPKQWVQPYTEQTLTQWGKDGVESVDIMSPAFAADCLETLEELNIANRELFVESGGADYSYIPCLNERSDFINVLAAIVLERLGMPQRQGSKT